MSSDPDIAVERDAPQAGFARSLAAAHLKRSTARTLQIEAGRRMLRDGELLTIAMSAALWPSSAIAFLCRRRQMGALFACVAGACTFATLARLRAGTGHRA